MDKQISAVTHTSPQAAPSLSARNVYTTSFASALQESEKNVAHQNKGESGKLILVGEISRGHQTVSELLIHNRELRDSTWKILSAPANQDKDYTRLQAGTKIYYNPADSSLSWGGTENTMGPGVASQMQAARAWRQLAEVGSTVNMAGEETGTSPVDLGVISKQRPTVSHLLKASQDYSSETWQIIGSSVNENKNFNRIPEGARVTLDPATNEISWQLGDLDVAGVGQMVRDSTPVTPASVSKIRPTPDSTNQPVERIVATELKRKPAQAELPQAGDLTEAVRPYFGKQYREINCYELLVKGLERMNIPYTGKDGLFSKLTTMAKEHGLPENAYLNGEGVVKAAGSTLLSKNYPHGSNWRKSADTLYSEIEPLLDRGQVLSFSTRRRGHTGIVSRQADQWTFINSGRLDNSLTTGVPRNGVGEENLKQEIHNWFKLASKSRESLSVTLGSLAPERVLTAKNSPPEAAISRRI